jgi:hypothetical protein
MIIDVDTVKLYLGITEEYLIHDELIERLIWEVEAHIEAIQNQPFELDSSDEPIYPAGYESTAAYMVGWNLKNRHGLKTLSIGDYSQTTQEMIQGYPVDLVTRIKRYAKVK